MVRARVKPELIRWVRKDAGLSVADAAKKAGTSELNSWRRAIQDRWVLVFQARGVEVDEIRGFSVAEEPMPVICLNSKDAPPTAECSPCSTNSATPAATEGGYLQSP